MTFKTWYQFSWVKLEQVNQEFKPWTNDKISIGFVCRDGKTTNSNSCENANFPQSTKIDTHRNKWINSKRNYISYKSITYTIFHTVTYLSIIYFKMSKFFILDLNKSSTQNMKHVKIKWDDGHVKELLIYVFCISYICFSLVILSLLI